MQNSGSDILDDILHLRNEIGRLYKILEINAVISASLNLETVLGNLMEKAKEVTGAEASSLMLLDEESQELYFHTIKGEKSEALKKIRLKLGEGIAGWVAKEAQSVLVEDCSVDPRFYKKADQNSGFVTRSMMCVPLKMNQTVLGTVQVLNKLDGTFFNETDLRMFEVLANQAAIAISNARLHRMATIDGMTGLYLKHFFLARLAAEYRKVKNGSGDLALIMSDIDFFKKVNDNFGHQGGDAALVELASVIKETVEGLGKDDIPGRYGGEEFCVLLPNTGPERALEVAEMIRTNIESRPIPIGDQFAKITISVGVSSYSVHKNLIKDPEDFIRLADEALYICKRKGRNCSSLYEEQPSQAASQEAKPENKNEATVFEIMQGLKDIRDR